jgi:hypothetical protein
MEDKKITTEDLRKAQKILNGPNAVRPDDKRLLGLILSKKGLIPVWNLRNGDVSRET